MATINSLPPEILHRILEIGQEGVRRVSLLSTYLVARRWRHSSQSLLWRKIRLSGEIRSTKLLESNLVGAYPCVWLSLSPASENLAAGKAIAACGTLQFLSISCPVDMELLTCSGLSSLKHLDLSYKVSVVDAYVPIIPYALESLSLRYFESLSSPHLIAAIFQASSATIRGLRAWLGADEPFTDALSTSLPLISDRLINLELVLPPTSLSLLLAHTPSYTSLLNLSIVLESENIWSLEAEIDSDAEELERLCRPHMSKLVTELGKLGCKLDWLEIGIWNLGEWVVPTLRRMLAIPACRNLSCLTVLHGARALGYSGEFVEFVEESEKKGVNVESFARGTLSTIGSWIE